MADIISLLKKIRSGDEDSFTDLCEMYGPMMQASAVHLDVDYDEVFSEACMALFRAATTYDVEQSEVTFGLYARICVRRGIIDYIRRTSVDRMVDEDMNVEELAADDDADAILIEGEERERFHRGARDLLSEYEYRVLLMWLEGEKTAEIALALDVSAKSVDNAKARIQKKLRDGLRPF